MRFSMLPVTGLALLFASPVFAQDMQMPWSGLYAGVNAGYGHSESNSAVTGQAAANTANIADGARPANVKMNSQGAIGGFQLGVNSQYDAWVFGIETDIQATTIRNDSNIVTTGTLFPGTRNNQFMSELDYLGTVRGRVGYAWDNVMFYGTGGFAYGGVKQTVNLFGPNPGAVSQFAGRFGKTETGYTVGGGLEFMVAPGLSTKTEFLYYNLGSSNVSAGVVAGNGGTGTGYNVNFKNYGSLIRIGLNYKL